MSEQTSQNETTEENDSTSIPELREAAKKGREATKKAADLERENAFLKAGIDTEDPKFKYFAKGYEGELTADAIKAEAEAAGFTAEPQTQTSTTENGGEGSEDEGNEEEHVSEEDREAERIANAVRSGANAPGEKPEVDPMNEGFSKFHERVAEGDRRQDASSEVIGRILGEGVGGNEKFLAKPSAEKE